MNQHHEYNRPSVAGPGCNYATLQSYDQNYFGRGAVVVPQASQSRSAEIVIPSYGGIAYNVLSNSKVPSCNGFYDISSAYPSGTQGCSSFSSNLCG
jgi:hypothetical protein